MKMLINVRFPHKPFNDAVRDGSIGAKMEAILAELKPEAVYFTEMNGHRGCIIVTDVENPSVIPALAEPWFLVFEADVEFRIVMEPEVLKEAGLAELGRKWA